MPDKKELSKSQKYMKNLDMDRLVDSVQQSLDCPTKIADAIAKLVSAKIYLEIVCEEEDMHDYLQDLEDQLLIHHVKDQTIH